MRGKRISMHLMLQNGVSQQLLSDSTLADQGLLSRLLISAPESIVGTRFSKEVKPESVKHIEIYNQRIKQLLEMPYPLIDGKTNELNPRTIILNPKATKAYYGFCDHVESLLSVGKEFEAIRGFANKMPEHAVRLASIIAVVNNVNISEIKEQDLDRGIKLVQYYASEALRLFDASHISPDLEIAIRLLHHLQHTWTLDIISLPDLYQSTLNAIRDKQTASKIVKILEEHGWLIKVEGGGEIKGVRRKDVWKIIKEPYHETIS